MPAWRHCNAVTPPPELRPKKVGNIIYVLANPEAFSGAHVTLRSTSNTPHRLVTIMVTQNAVVERRRFTAEDLRAMVEVGIIPSDEQAILRDGRIFVRPKTAQLAYSHRRDPGPFSGDVPQGVILMETPVHSVQIADAVADPLVPDYKEYIPRCFIVGEYYRMAEVGILHPDERIELLAGELINMAAIGNRHAFCVRWLIKALVIALGDLAVLDAQNPIRFDDRNELQPDVMILRWRDDGYQELPGRDDVLLVIEVSDTTVGFDRNHKVPLYAAQGIPEIWLFNLRDRRVEIYDQPLAGGYERMRTMELDGILAPLALPDVAIRVNQVMPD